MTHKYQGKLSKADQAIINAINLHPTSETESLMIIINRLVVDNDNINQDNMDLKQHLHDVIAYNTSLFGKLSKHKEAIRVALSMMVIDTPLFRDISEVLKKAQE